MSKLGSNRKLKQTTISSFFSELGGRLTKAKSRRKLLSSSVYATPNKSCIRSTMDESLLISCVNPLTIASIPKRKLPAPIFSDDEDSENSFESPLKRPQRTKSPKEPSITLSPNRLSPVKCKRSLCFESSKTSSPESNLRQLDYTFSPKVPPKSKSNKQNEEKRFDSKSKCNNTSEKDSPKKIYILEDIIISPKKDLKKSAQDNNAVSDGKKDSKKINYENLKVIREFFINVLKSNYLKNLLSDSDKKLLNGLFNLEKNYQYVCVKLFMWQKTWYNIFQCVQKVGLEMQENEICDMYNCLKENKFVDTEYMSEETFTLLNLLSLKQVKDIARSFRIHSVGTKDILIVKLLKQCRTQITLTPTKNTEEVLRQRIKENMGFCVKLSSDLEKCLYYVFLLNTFTNLSLVAPRDYFTNVDFFNVVFPTYKVENFHIFYTPQEFSAYAKAVKLRCDFEKLVEKKNIINIFEICKCAFSRLSDLNNNMEGTFADSREPHLENFTPNAQYIYIISTGAKSITTSKFNDVKLWFEYLISQKYCRSKRCYWYCHLALIYSLYLKEYEKAAMLVIKAFEEEKEHFTEIQLHELAHRGKMLNKKTYNLPQLLHDQIASLIPPSCDRSWPQDILNCKSIPRPEQGGRRLYAYRDENDDVTYLSVEQTALKYYQSLGYPNGEHCEGNLIIASFTLLFWDIIYEKYVRGSFVSTVQNAPLDMYSKYFFINREIYIVKRLKSIEKNWSEEKLKKTLFTNFELHSHENSLCQIDSVVNDVQELYNVLICIGRPVLSKIFERLAKDFKAYRSGFPDLILWNLEEKRAKFVEVKSENDTLSIKQKLWLNYLSDIGASVALCRVEPKSSKKKLAIFKPCEK